MPLQRSDFLVVDSSQDSSYCVNQNEAQKSYSSDMTYLSEINTQGIAWGKTITTFSLKAWNNMVHYSTWHIILSTEQEKNALIKEVNIQHV